MTQYFDPLETRSPEARAEALARALPEQIRVDNGPELISSKLVAWTKQIMERLSWTGLATSIWQSRPHC